MRELFYIVSVAIMLAVIGYVAGWSEYGRGWHCSKYVITQDYSAVCVQREADISIR
jgi:hypothetical protein